MSRLRILVGEHHELVRRGLRWILEQQTGWEVCAEAGDSDRAIAIARDLKPDLVILDLSLPGMGSLEATHQLRQALPQTKLLVLGPEVAEQLVRAVVTAGAQGYLTKADAPTLLTTAIESIIGGLPFFTTSFPPEKRAQTSAAPAVKPVPSFGGRLLHVCQT